MPIDLDTDVDNALGAGSSPADPFEAAAAKWKVPAAVLRGMYQVESSGGKNLRSPAGALGPMGLMPALAKAYGVTDPNDLGQATDAAARYLREGLNKYGGDLNKSLQYYHGGPDESGWGDATQAYPQQVYSAAPPHKAAQADLSDVDAGLAGLSPPKAPVPVMQAAPTASWSGAGELANGLLLGQGTKLAAGVRAVGDSLHGGPLSLGQNYTNELNAVNAGRKDYEAANPGTSLTADLAGSTISSLPLMAAGGEGAAALGGRLADAAPAIRPLVSGLGRFLGGSAGDASDGIGGWLLRRASQAGSGAVQGTAAAGLQSGLSDKDEGSDLATGAGVGSVVNAAVAPTISAALSPFAASLTPQVARLAQSLQNQGLHIPGWAMSTSPELRSIGNSVAPLESDLHSDWTRALSHTIGVDSSSLDQNTLSQARGQIGKRLDAAAKGSDIPWDLKLGEDTKAAHDAVVGNELAPQNVQNAVAGLQNDIENRMLQHSTGPNAAPKMGFSLTGDDYENLTSANGRIGKLLASPDPYAQAAGKAYKSAFWDALDRNYAGHGDEWSEAKTQYKNLKVLEDATAKAGPNGIPSSAALMGAVARHYPNFAQTGAGDIGDLAEGGKFLPALTPQGDVKPSGGHFPINLNSPLGWVTAAGLGTEALHGGKELLHLAAEHPGPTALGAVALGSRTLAKHAVGKYISSPEYTNTLIQRSLGGGGSSPLSAALVPNPLIPVAVGVYNQ